MHAGKLRYRAEIQHLAETGRDAGGVATSEWITEPPIRHCYLKPLRGDELEDAQQIHAKVTHEFWFRYSKSITADRRIRARGRTFEIRAVLNEDERDRWLRVLAEERPGA